MFKRRSKIFGAMSVIAVAGRWPPLA